MIRSSLLCSVAAAALVVALGAGAALADEPGAEGALIAGLNQDDLADDCRVKIMTRDGDEWKTSRVWNAVLDRRVYVLSSRSGWYQRATADPNVVLQVDGNDYPLRARTVDDEALRGQVHDALKEKCGCRYRLRSFFTFWRSNKVLQLVPRPPGT